MEQFKSMLTNEYVIESKPRLEGRNMIMVLGPVE